jgi:hypothetical protein
VHAEPQPTEEQLYAELYGMFPQYLEKIEYREPDETGGTAETPFLFLNQLGYRLTTTDDAALAKLRAGKVGIVETFIENS